MALFPSVDGYRNDVDGVEEDALNRPINQLRERTDFLKQQLDAVVGSGPFESMRLQDVDLSTNAPPALFDVVYIHPSDLVFEAALSESLVENINPYTQATDRTFGVGLLTESPGASKGTVVLHGKVDLTGILLAGMLEGEEEFRAGPYYLSSREAGKLTAVPSGPAVFIGYFLESDTNPGYGDYAVISPQYKDLWESHSHFFFALAGHPAGDNEPTGVTPADITRVRGIKPDEYLPGGTEDGNEPPYRLFLLGEWTGQGTPQYTVWIEASDDTMATCKVFWSTDDGSDDSFPGFDDSTEVSYIGDYGATVGRRVSGYEKPTAIGTRGLYVVLEKGFDSTLASPDWDSADFDAVVTGAVALGERQWTIEVPERLRGWLPKWNRVDSTYAGTTADPGYTLRLFGDYDHASRRLEELTVAVTLAGDFTLNNVTLEVSDIDGTVIATAATVGFAGNAVDLGNGLWLAVTPYTSAGAAAGTSLAVLTDAWTFAFTNEPNAKFKYNLGMDRTLSLRYPPQPPEAFTLEKDGVNQARYGFFTAGAGVFRAAPDTLYWYPYLYEEAPFPADWETLTSPGAVTVDLAGFLNKMGLGATGLVTSLKTAENSLIRIVNCQTREPSDVGDLEIIADFRFSSEDTNLSGFQVVKGVGASGLLTRGPVVEKILPGAGIIVTESNPGFPGQGVVRIANADTGLIRGEFNEISLLNAKQELVPNRLFSFVKLLGYDSGSAANVPTAFLAKFRVPQALTSKYKVVIYATIFGLGDVTVGANVEDTKYSGLTFTYSVLQDLTNEVSPDVPVYVPRNLATVGANGVIETTVVLPDDVPLGKLGDGYTAYDPVLLHNDVGMPAVEGQVIAAFMDSFPGAAEDPDAVTAGDLVAIKFERSAPVGVGHAGAPFEYTDALGFINLGWKLVEV